MLNWIWMAMILVGIGAALAGGRPEVVTEAAFAGAAEAIRLALEMAGLMMLWMGLLKLAEKSGLVQALGRALRPLLRRLFPDLEKDSPAFNSIILNVSANFLGLGNAATPFGLKAMAELQRLNSEPKRASDAMITFLLLNTSALTLIPTMVIALRAENGSAAPEEIILPAFLAGAVGLTVGLLCHRLLKRFF